MTKNSFFNAYYNKNDNIKYLWLFFLNKEKIRNGPVIQLEQIDSLLDRPITKKKKISRYIFTSINFDTEDLYMSTYVQMFQSIREMIPEIEPELLEIQIIEVYHTFWSEPKFSNLEENSLEILEEWKNFSY